MQAGAPSTDAAEVRDFLDRQGLSDIISEFVRDCARERPESIIHFMYIWAAVRVYHTTVPETIPVPRIEPATGTSALVNPPQPNLGAHPDPTAFAVPVTSTVVGAHQPGTPVSGGVPVQGFPHPHQPPGLPSHSPKQVVPERKPVPPRQPTPPITRPAPNYVQPSVRSKSPSVSTERSPNVPPLPSRRPSSNHRSPPQAIVVLAGPGSGKEELRLAINVMNIDITAANLSIATSTSQPPGSVSQVQNVSPEFLDAIQRRLEQYDVTDVEVLGVNTDSVDCVFLDSPHDDLTADLISCTAAADAAVLCVPASVTNQDAQLRRDGALFHRALMAHSLAIKRVCICITQTRDYDAAQVQIAVDAATRMMTKCGFDSGRLTHVVFPATVEDICSALMRLPWSAPQRFSPELALQVKCTVLVVSAQVSGGQVFDVFSLGHFQARIAAVLDESNQSFSSEGTLSENSVGTIFLSVLGGLPVQIGIQAPVVLRIGNYIVAMGTVVAFEIPELCTLETTGGSGDDSIVSHSH